MTLAALIRKRETGKPANANPAKVANDERAKGEPLAGLAVLALANPPEAKTANPIPKIGADDAVTASYWWRIHYPHHAPVEVACSPPATYAEILVWQPDASAAEPFEPIPRQPTAPLTAHDEATVRAWLAHIGETDFEIIAVVLNQCRTDADARDYFISQAADVPRPAAFNDDRRLCGQCANLTGRGVCLAARRGEILASRNYEPIRTLPRRCEGYAPGAMIQTDGRGANAGWDWLRKGSENERNAGERLCAIAGNRFPHYPQIGYWIIARRSPRIKPFCTNMTLRVGMMVAISRLYSFPFSKSQPGADDLQAKIYRSFVNDKGRYHSQNAVRFKLHFPN